ncbi:N-acetylmuramoyl-L-alanine amidase [Lewinella aquimaris]|uniref:N-acetylmuramoyl-L-alanine amidase n=1 Tax=Neolewinella aquimaris TaxID=1835722 RepID=A0A840ED29_9BACT|nr:N-acetylmuramoyl-L-alanine amidase [Neolewinella aquimaris]MBB4079709.1 N-acetylmuramoyl-L-alanine amidase [Neolewinella aquimaris]
MFTITNHLLTPARQFPLRHGSQAVTPRYIVLHYDAGATLAGSLNHLRNSNLSYHMLIDRDGSSTQCVPFNRKAWHAGRSNYRDISEDVNAHAIGISMANRGAVNKYGDRYWLEYEVGQRIGDPLTADQVVRGYHPNGGSERYWERFPNTQVAACREICRSLIEIYPTIVDVVGHDEIAIGRKVDPGPAFPMASLYDLVPDRGWKERHLYRVNTPGETLNVRRGPGSDTDINGVLQHGQLVYGRSFAYQNGTATKWLSISLDERHVQNGFVHADHLEKV